MIADRANPLSTWSRSRYSQISRLLDEFLALPLPARAQWLEALALREPELAADLHRLLQPAECRAAQILAAAENLADQLAPLPPLDQSLVGRRFGPYCIRSLLGHGGMGSVWLAERADGLFTRRVALKLVHPALVGLGLAERLARERAILASLDHPNIARLYDAGFADDGQPYLALEHVAGTPFGAYCDRRRLALRERLQLFLQVLAAVQYAHAHLVIHRDLKPSNILVTDEGRVCLLDFGIAKLFRDGVASETELTRLSGRALSLEYAAPEQIAGAPITIAADIYSLGVMLYELLSGQAPYRLARRSRAALEDSILRTDAVPLGRATVAQAEAAVRATSAKSLTRSLRGDLETVVMKALRKDPAERYATVDALAEDLSRWLRNEPIIARRDHIAYRAAKFVRRHWAAIAVAGAFVLALTSGLIATSYEASVAARQRDAALRAESQSLTQTALACLREGDAAGALGIALELLRRPRVERADPTVLAIFQEARAADAQTLAFTVGQRLPEVSATSIDYSPDGRRILTHWGGHSALIWDAMTGRELSTFSAGQGTATIEDAEFSPDGRRILVATSDRIARIRDVQTGRVLVELRGHTDRVWNATFSPDGRRVVTASWDRTARIWDASTGQELLRLAHDDKVYSARFSYDGRRVITGSHDETARVWDAATGREILRLSGLGELVFAAAFSHDGRRLVTASGDGTARIWDAATGRLIVPLVGHGDAVSDASFSADDRFVLTSSEDHTARIWDAAYGRQMAVLVHPGKLWGARFSPDGHSVATISPDGTARVWRNPLDARSSRLIRRSEQVVAATFSPDGRRILTASFDRTAVIWDARTLQPLTTLRGHTDRLWCAAFSPDGQRVVTGSRDGTARVWDAQTGRELLRLQHASGVRSATFSPDGRHILTGSHDRTVRIWDAASGRELLRLEGHTEEVAFAAFSPDSRRVLTAAADGTARIWDAGTGRELLRLQGHAGGMESAAFSPDGRRIVTASDDRTARIWDATTGRELIRLSGDEDSVLDAQFSADGLRIVTASRDRSVRVWESATGHLLAVFNGHDDAVESVEFSRDGRYIISASDDHTARIWDATIPTLEQQLLWARAAEFDPLAPSLRAAADFSPAAAGVHADAGDSAGALALARQGDAAELAARGATTESERTARLLEAFGFFAAADARAEHAGWPDDAAMRWRYRRASLARVLARAGMMPQVAQIYARVIREQR